jgi:ribosomal protein S18 acetylase RimI-like enzyme
VLAAAGRHPLARVYAVGAVRGWLGENVVVWIGGHDPQRAHGCALGDPVTAARLLARVREGGQALREVHLPRMPVDVLRAHLPIGPPDQTTLRWTRTAPPAQPGEDRIHRLGPSAYEQIDELLDEVAAPAATRPGAAEVRAWWGVREQGRVLACGAACGYDGTGLLTAIAVTPGKRRQGLGTALTAVLTRAALRGRAADRVALLRVADANAGADRIYRRLGYTAGIPLTSGPLALPIPTPWA